MSSEVITISAGKHPVLIAGGLPSAHTSLYNWNRYENHDFIVLMDENTHRHCLPLISTSLPDGFHKIVIGPGELNKTWHSCHVAIKRMLQLNTGRQSVLINLGGGMVTDLGGFIASVYMRGISFVNIPTSLLGMVDASSGGKTGVDFEGFKNIIGLFSFPDKVFIFPAFLKSLPEAEWRNGVAEMVKHGLIADKKLWHELSGIITNKNFISDDVSRMALINLIESAVRVKAMLVAGDPHEKHERMFLNFGHTIGHAYESWSLGNDAAPVSHGQAIGAGLICESYISEKIGSLPEEQLKQIISVVKLLFHYKPIPRETMQQIAAFTRKDKKNRKHEVVMALLANTATPEIVHGVNEQLIVESLHFYNSVII